MGIKKINSYLQSLNLVSEFTDLSVVVNYIKTELKTNKKYLIVAIDTNLYMYKYIRANVQDNKINFLTLFSKQITKLIKNKIIPFYIFDSYPDELKKDTIDIRLARKTKAIEKIIELTNTNVSSETEIDAEDYNKKLLKLNLQSISVTNNHIHKLQKLLNKLNIPYAIAPEQSDSVCAKLVQYNIVDACLSEDMDILIGGAKFLIKSANGKFFVYNYDKIIKSLNIDQKQLCIFSVLLGSDYSRSINNKVTPNELLTLCKNYDFSICKVIENIVNIDIHRNFFSECKNNKTPLSLTDITDTVCSDKKCDDIDLIKKMVKHYELALDLITLYNVNESNIKDFFDITKFYNIDIITNNDYNSDLYNHDLYYKICLSLVDIKQMISN